MSPHPLAGRIVLDAGAGTGVVSAALTARRAQPVAIDLSFDMLAWNARRQAAVRGRRHPRAAARAPAPSTTPSPRSSSTTSPTPASRPGRTGPRHPAGWRRARRVFSNASRSEVRDRDRRRGPGRGLAGSRLVHRPQGVRRPAPRHRRGHGSGRPTRPGSPASSPGNGRSTWASPSPSSSSTTASARPIFAAWLDALGPARARAFAAEAERAIQEVMQPYRPVVVFLRARTNSQ